MAHARKWTIDSSLPVQAIRAASRFLVRVQEPIRLRVAEKRKQEALQRVIQAMNAVGLVDAFGNRHESWQTWEDAASHRREKARVDHEDSEALQAILRTHGNDTEEAVREVRRFLVEHPKSRLGYSYLGGVLQKRH